MHEFWYKDGGQNIEYPKNPLKDKRFVKIERLASSESIPRFFF